MPGENKNIMELLKRFPKTRPQLSDEIARIYDVQYKNNRKGNSPASSISQKVEAWLHKQVASDVGFGNPSKSTLEIGAGTLNQLAYETPAGQYDIVEPYDGLYKDSEHLGEVRNKYADISDIPKNSRYERITSVAAFEHICNLPEVIARAGLLLNDNGVLRVAIPSEGTFLWTLGWKMTTGLEFRLKYGLDYGVLMKYEHVNTAEEIERLLNYFFESVQGKAFGLSKSFSLYQFYSCSKPCITKCNEQLATLKNVD